MRCRDLSEPLGDLSRAVRRYEALTGEDVPLGSLSPRGAPQEPVRLAITPIPISKRLITPLR